MASHPSFELDAEVREDMGKGASRRLRRSGTKVLGILYGGQEDALPIVLEHRHVSKALENPTVYSHILTLNIKGKAQKVVLKDIQRHPNRPQIQHMDFQRIRADQALTMHVPLKFHGELDAPGLKEGGVISKAMVEVEIRCLPDNLPEYIDVDVSHMQMNDVLHLSDLKLPKGVELTAMSHGHDNNLPLVSIHMPKVVAEEEVPVETAEAPAAEGAEGAAPAAAPAAATPSKEGKPAGKEGGKK